MPYGHCLSGVCDLKGMTLVFRRLAIEGGHVSVLQGW